MKPRLKTRVNNWILESGGPLRPSPFILNSPPAMPPVLYYIILCARLHADFQRLPSFHYALYIFQQFLLVCRLNKSLFIRSTSNTDIINIISHLCCIYTLSWTDLGGTVTRRDLV